MKIIVILISVLVAMNIYLSMYEKGPSILESKYGGTHKLMKMENNTSQTGSMSGWFFLGVGGISGSEQTNRTITFAWENNEGEYVFTTLPLQKVRIQFMETSAPYIRFKWSTFFSEDDGILYALILCNKKDWNLKIELPMQAG